MKKSTFLTALCLLASSCTPTIDTPDTLDNSAPLTPITVTVSGFSVEQSPFTSTRANESVTNYGPAKFLTLAFYKTSDGSEVYKHTQEKDNLAEGETFGNFSTALAIGSYTMVALCNDGNNATTLTSPTSATFGDSNVKETLVATQSVNITNNNALPLSVTLERVVAALAVKSTDIRPAEVTKMRFTFYAGSKSFNPSTGYATSDDGFVCLVGLGDKSIGTTTNVGSYLFLASDEENVNVTIDMLNADGDVLFCKTADNVPLKRNRATVLKGAVYSNTSVTANTFEIGSDWLPDLEKDF